ncbi:MAG: hypothetical protein ACOYM2_01715 [Rectinemataceae bacterium]
MMRFGRFTQRGGDAVEAQIRNVVVEGGEIARSILPPGSFRCLVLMGGYGRGEGGVEVTGGQERPHNNLDFLLVTTGPWKRRTEELRKSLGEALRPLAERAGIGIDVGATSDAALLRAPCRVMWYDVRFGHQTILGDQGFLPSLGRFTADRILSDDIRDLLVNRGTLLVINDAVAALPTPDPAAWKALVRHAVKAILGYGDALLYWRGAYHWSYAERQRRMAARDDVGEDFRKLYDAAMEFRFRPDYAEWEGRDLKAWLGGIRKAVEPVHLDVEGLRCGMRGQGWKAYPAAALSKGLADGLRSPREAARRAKALLRSRGSLSSAGFGLAPSLLPMRDLLGIVFPVIAYDLAEPEFRTLARAVVGGAEDPEGLRLAFLRAWGVHGDPNFEAAARKLGIELRGGRA